MSWHTVQLAEVQPRPWRNGAGVTRELACWPEPSNWVWRMSVAEIAHSGPFSRFEGVQRWFAVLRGDGVRLCVGGLSQELTSASAPLCFDGALPVDCELLGDATQDFNLMVRHDTVSAQMKRVEGKMQLVVDAPKIIAIYPINTGARVQLCHYSQELAAHSLVWQRLDAGATVQINAENALWMEVDV